MSRVSTCPSGSVTAGASLAPANLGSAFEQPRRREVMGDVLGTKRAVHEPTLEGRTQGLFTVRLQQIVQTIHVAHPHPWPTVCQLGDRSGTRGPPYRSPAGARASCSAWLACLTRLPRAELGDRAAWIDQGGQEAARGRPRSAQRRSWHDLGTGAGCPESRGRRAASSRWVSWMTMPVGPTVTG